MIRIILALLLASGLPLLAQQGTGSISGTVTDALGAAVPAADVKITNTGTNAVSQAATNESGYFTVPALRVGNYQVTVEKAGFKVIQRSGITLQVDQRVALNLKLEVGAMAESISVASAGTPGISERGRSSAPVTLRTAPAT